MPGTSLAKAELINIEEKRTVVRCLFNPQQYTFSKQNSWSRGKNTAGNVPDVTFGGGQPATLQMQIFFDTYAVNTDVREHTDKVWKLMLVDPKLKDPTTKKGRPPRVRFQWGTSWSFEAVITSLKQQFTLFKSDGTPVRAMLDVSFQQIHDASLLPKQNPTSGSAGEGRAWVVRQGDTLPWIAYRQYGDPNRWREIAEANGLTDTRRLRPGTELRIP